MWLASRFVILRHAEHLHVGQREATYHATHCTTAMSSRGGCHDVDDVPFLSEQIKNGESTHCMSNSRRLPFHMRYKMNWFAFMPTPPIPTPNS